MIFYGNCHSRLINGERADARCWFIFLLIRRGSSGTFSGAYVQDVFDSEEKAWNKVEDDFNRFSELVLELGYKVRECAFLKHGLYFAYEKFVEDLYGYVKYEILTLNLK